MCSCSQDTRILHTVGKHFLYSANPAAPHRDVVTGCGRIGYISSILKFVFIVTISVECKYKIALWLHIAMHMTCMVVHLNSFVRMQAYFIAMHVHSTNMFAQCHKSVPSEVEMLLTKSP